LFITLALILAGLTVPGALNVRPANAQGCGDFIDLNVAANNITSLRNTISTAANASTLNKIRVNVPSGTYTLGGTELNIPSPKGEGFSEATESGGSD